MKQKLLKIVLPLVAVLSVTGASAQANIGPEWGDNDSTRLANRRIYSFFRDSYEMKLYDEAAGHLQHLMKEVPGVRPELYHAGVNIYKIKLNVTEDDEQMQIYGDSILMLYDEWIKYFGDNPERGRPYLMRAKAIDYMNLMGNDRERVGKLLKEAVLADTTMQFPDMVNVYFQHLTDDYKLFETMEVDDYLSEYEALAELIDKFEFKDKEATKEMLEALALSSGALGCGNLETIYGPRLEANPEDKEMYKKALSLLRRNKCSGPFYTSVIEGLHKIDPSSSTALILVTTFEDKKEYAKAIEFLKSALEQETEPSLKENIYVRLSANYLGTNNAKAAADNAKQAIALNPDSGLGYYMLAQAYAAGANSCADGFERQTAYWLVYDNLALARRLLANDDKQISDIDSQMATYRRNFPNKEESFFRGLEEGSAYTVNCGWVSGKTTVRTVQ